MPFHIVGWHVATTCLFMTGIVWGGTWRLRATYVDYSYFCALVGVRIYTCPYMCTQLKIHDIKSLVFLVPEVSLAQFYFLFDGPGMSFVEGIVCPQASETWCDNIWEFSPLLVFIVTSFSSSQWHLPLTVKRCNNFISMRSFVEKKLVLLIK